MVPPSNTGSCYCDAVLGPIAWTRMCRYLSADSLTHAQSADFHRHATRFRTRCVWIEYDITTLDGAETWLSVLELDNLVQHLSNVQQGATHNSFKLEYHNFQRFAANDIHA